MSEQKLPENVTASLRVREALALQLMILAEYEPGSPSSPISPHANWREKSVDGRNKYRDKARDIIEALASEFSVDIRPASKKAEDQLADAIKQLMTVPARLAYDTDELAAG